MQDVSEESPPAPVAGRFYNTGSVEPLNVTFNAPNDAQETFEKIKDLDDLQDKFETNG